MKAVILAGGFGIRMRPLTLSRPKPLMPLLNKPVTAHILDLLQEHGVTEVAITTNYLREQIHAFFGNEYKGIKLTYPAEEQPLGTAGCVKNIEGFFDETFIVMQGDTITDLDLTQLVRDHRQYGGLATLAAIHVDDPWNYGVMELADDNRIRQFYEKPMIDECTTNLANTGIYILEPEALEHIPLGKFFDFAKDLFPILLERQSLFASALDGFWVDIGRPDGYIKAKKWLMARMESRIPSSAQIDGRLEGSIYLGENVHIGAHSHLIGPVLLGDNVILEKGSVIGPYTVLGQGVNVRNNTVINGAVLFEDTEVGSGGDISSSLIAERVRIGSNGTIQSDVIIGGRCNLEEGVSVINGSRIWPGMDITDHSMVSGTLKMFISSSDVNYDPKWELRSVTADEAFYFNKLSGGHVSYTGKRALSLSEFNSILHNVDASSLEFHMRSNVNDFKAWLDEVICDRELSRLFADIKNEVPAGNRHKLRYMMLDATARRIDDLIREVKRVGYV